MKQVALNVKLNLPYAFRYINFKQVDWNKVVQHILDGTNTGISVAEATEIKEVR